MVFLVLGVQLAVASLASTYSSPSLRTVVSQAAAHNRVMPSAVRRYVADVESEVALVVRQAAGADAVMSLEQIGSQVRWTRPGRFEQHVIGDRLQASGPQLTALSFLRQSLLVPHLYGNRIQLLFGRDSSQRRVDRARPGRQVAAIHPLSDERERIYLFSGGDTVVTMQVGPRRIPVVHVRVTPRNDIPSRTVVFSGDMYLDVTRGQLVRLRGRFYSMDESQSFFGRALAATLEGALYVDLENLEVDRRVWLPASQRFEAQVLFRIASEIRSVFRLVSSFRSYQVTDDAVRIDGSADSLEANPHGLTIATGDSLGRYSGWQRSLGVATQDARSEDFDDVAPDAWRPTGRPTLQLRSTRLADLVHINRVEGWYTGLAADFAARDAMPGFRLQANAGWAWQEGTARGRIISTFDKGGNQFGAAMGWTLDITNDFRPPLDSGSTLGALLGVDDYDYVRRDLMGVSWRRNWGSTGGVSTGLEYARVHDGEVSVHLPHGPFGSGQEFRSNRGVTEGKYGRSVGTLALNPRVAIGFVQPGVGAQVMWQRGDGDLRYQRAEVRLVARWHGERVTSALRVDAGMVDGRRIPAQQLFEVGAAQGLLGYDYKEFAGDRAIVVRGLTMRALPMLRAPWRIGSRVILPAPAPAVSLTAQSAWVGVEGAAARQALADLSRRVELPSPGLCDRSTSTLGLVSRPTCSWRTSVGVGLRFFGSSVGVHFARPVDRRGHWKLLFSVSQVL